MFKLDDLQSTRNVSGVYFLYNENKELVYIGKSNNIYLRILEHSFENVKKFSYFKFAKTKTEIFAELMEINLIELFSGKYNLYNKTKLGTTFKNFYLHLPTEIKNKLTLKELELATLQIIDFIEDKNEFNCKYINEPTNCKYNIESMILTDLEEL